MQQTSTDAALGLGCSLGDRFHRIELSTRQLHAHPRIRVVGCSRLYRTPALRGGSARGWFLNAVLRVRTELDSLALLQVCRELEERAGRRRCQHWGDRTLDIDVLLFGATVANTEKLRLPHPGIPSRPFVLTPLLEVWPDAKDPRSQVRYSVAPAPPAPRAVPVGSLPFPLRSSAHSAT